MKLTSKQRMQRMEAILDLLMAAMLRGHLQPSERRVVKKYLTERKLKKQKAKQEARGLRCPACRSPLEKGELKRCPWCHVLLTEFHLASSGSK